MAKCLYSKILFEIIYIYINSKRLQKCIFIHQDIDLDGDTYTLALYATISIVDFNEFNVEYLYLELLIFKKHNLLIILMDYNKDTSILMQIDLNKVNLYYNNNEIIFAHIYLSRN